MVAQLALSGRLAACGLSYEFPPSGPRLSFMCVGSSEGDHIGRAGVRLARSLGSDRAGQGECAVRPWVLRSRYTTIAIVLVCCPLAWAEKSADKLQLRLVLINRLAGSWDLGRSQSGRLSTALESWIREGSATRRLGAF